MANNAGEFDLDAYEFWRRPLRGELLECKQRFEEGDHNALMDALHCFVRRTFRDDPGEVWLADEFFEAYRLVAKGHKATWDEAFGRPYRKKTDANRRRKDWPIGHKIVAAIDRLRGGQEHWALENDLFEEVGKRFGIGKTLCGEIYRRYRNDRKVGRLPRFR